MNHDCLRRLPRAVATIVLLSLGGCAPHGMVRPATEWPERRAELQALEAWSLSGRVAVAASGRGFSARLDWAQQAAASRIDLGGPFGAGALRVEVAGDEITVRDHDGVIVAAGREAVARQLGVELPVRELRYWMLGVPAPRTGAGVDAVEVVGRNGRPVAFNDDGWWVRVEDWTPVADDVLPRRLVLERPGLRLKLVIDAWRLEARAP